MHHNLSEASALLYAAAQALERNCPAVFITVQATRGSAPRFAGAAMLVTENDVTGTVGGGHLEYTAIELARQALAEHTTPLLAVHEYPLGAALGQCCGGAMTLRYEALCAAHLPALQANINLHKTLFLFGAGHVAQALLPIIGSLPLRIVWADSRDAVNTHQSTFPESLTNHLPAHITTVVSDTLASELGAAQPGDLALIMTHSHALDEALVHAALRVPQLAYIGLIGSATKRRLFEQRLSQRGFSETDLRRLTCPIGVVSPKTPHSKLPSVIALHVAAQLTAYL